MISIYIYPTCVEILLKDRKMENNLKNGQSFKWINHLKTITKSSKDKEIIEMDKNKSQQSSKSHSIVSLFKKLSLGKEKGKTPIKDNAEKTVLSVNEIIKCFPKIIKVEESATNSKNKLKSDDSIKISNDPSDAINSSWIDWGDIKSDSVIKYSNYLKTTICRNKLKSTDKSNLENSNTDIRFETKNTKVEGNDLDVKAKSNYNSDRDETLGKDVLDTEKVCKSKVDSNNDQNSSDDEVIERGPQKVYQNKGSHRLNPMQRKDDLVNTEVHDHYGKTTSAMKQSMTSSFSIINNPESYVSSLSKDNFWDYGDPLKQYAKNNAAQAGFLCTPNTENNDPGIISEDEVNNMLDRLAEYYIRQDSRHMSSSKLGTVDSKVSKTIEKYITVENIKNMLKLESLAFIQERNALMGDINLEKQKLFKEIEEQIEIQNIKKMLELESVPYALKNKVILKENNKEAAEVFQNAFKSLSLEHFMPVPFQNSYGFVKSNKLSELNVRIPESNHSFPRSNCSSPECNFNLSECIYSSPGTNCSSSQCNYNSSGSNHSSPQHNYNSPEYNYSSSPQQNFNFPECKNSSSQHNYNYPAYNYSSSSECNNSYPKPNYNLLECNYNFPGYNYSSSPGSSHSSHDSIAENESVEEFMAEMQNYVNYYFKFNNLAHDSTQKSKQPGQGKIWSTLNNDYFKGISPNDQKTSCSGKTKARNMLVISAVFSEQKCLDECLKIYKEIRDGKLGIEDKEVIHYLNPTGKNKYIRTNLHAAVMEGNLEKVFCLVEIHKQCHENISYSINMKDKNDSRNRTALDRAQENENSVANNLLIGYLKENYAKNALSKVRANTSRKKHS
ncbi:hypothetical protein JTE90_009505 [Oedothorax gibbosus]|uniref:Uncharacterized protein n=1 Tax=Oedothorax gibbosus TaxID=931172 RepID=A0AAV6USR5_9ARAC|nr:hypothetical protein JTE90_009505 [Oedothorax gibbosus]